MSAPAEKNPRECWLKAMQFLDVAIGVRPTMKHGLNADNRDTATKLYVEAVDRLVDTLDAMAKRGHLDDVGAFLDAQFGRV